MIAAQLDEIIMRRLASDEMRDYDRGRFTSAGTGGYNRQTHLGYDRC